MPRLIGVAALFTGAGLLGFLLINIPLAISVAGCGVAAAGLVLFAWRRSGPVDRRRMRVEAAAGLSAGIAAVALYDVIRIGLAGLDPSPYDPLEAIRGFGRALIGDTADPGSLLAVGFTFHLVTGTLFGLGYIAVAADPKRSRRRTWVIRGIAWALFLEAFQLAFYPAWLGIVFVREFTLIATAAHIGYGIVLGLVAREMLLRFNREKPWPST